MAINTVSKFLNDVFNSSYFDNVVVVSVIKSGLPSFRVWDQMWDILSSQRKTQLCQEIRQFLGHPSNVLDEGNEYLLDTKKSGQIFHRLKYFYHEEKGLIE